MDSTYRKFKFLNLRSVISVFVLVLYTALTTTDVCRALLRRKRTSIHPRQNPTSRISTMKCQQIKPNSPFPLSNETHRCHITLLSMYETLARATSLSNDV